MRQGCSQVAMGAAGWLSARESVFRLHVKVVGWLLSVARRIISLFGCPACALSLRSHGETRRVRTLSLELSFSREPT